MLDGRAARRVALEDYERALHQAITQVSEAVAGGDRTAVWAVLVRDLAVALPGVNPSDPWLVEIADQISARAWPVREDTV